MAYIGKPPNTAIVNQATSQSFSGNGSTTAFTLTRSVNVGEDLEVFVNNVQQEPGSGKSYTASGTTLTFDEAPPSGTNNVYVIYRGEATINPRLEHDANSALAATTGTFTGAFTSPGIDDNASATAITIDSSGRVGIGATNMDESLLIQQTASGANTDVTIRSANDGNSRINFGDQSSDGSGRVDYDHTSNYMAVTTNSSERLRIDSSGHFGLGTTTPGTYTAYVSGSTSPGLVIAGTQPCLVLSDTDVSGSSSTAGITKSGDSTLINNLGGGNLDFYNNGSFRMRLDSSGDLVLAHTTGDFTVASVGLIDGNTNHKYIYSAHTSTNTDESCLYLNRQSSDGRIVDIRQANSIEGSISVSGNAVSFNGGHLARWSRLTDNAKPTTLLKGTVMSNLDDMIVWTGEDNEQLNHTKVSDTEGDVSVAGVFVSWDVEDDYNDFYLGMTGDMVIRIASGTTVARGDLLMSAGDGTAKPQGDDIVRSKTIAKVTSTNVSHTYDDGSYLVPCVLMAC